jgi:hypothetical protein
MIDLRAIVKPYIQTRGFLKILRFVESIKYMNPHVFNTIMNIEKGNKIILDSLNCNSPQAIGKIGSTELASLKKYLRYIDQPNKDELTKIDREILYNNSGVYPPSYEIFEPFCKLFLNDVLPELDSLAVWFNIEEASIAKKYCKKANYLALGSLETYVNINDNIWTSWLKEKKVLVIHPFKNSIEFQYKRRQLIWSNQNILPLFELKTLAPPHYPSMVKPKFNDWFESLENLKTEMSKIDFDIALIGAGAYSLPLALHAKKMGKHGIHIGGALQIYFGIYGNRWEAIPEIRKHRNEYWIRPLKEDTPPKISLVENGCYW